MIILFLLGLISAALFVRFQALVAVNNVNTCAMPIDQKLG